MIVTGSGWPARASPPKGAQRKGKIMSDLKNTVALAATVGEQMGNAIVAMDKAFAKALESAQEAGFDPSVIADGEGKKAFEQGVMIGWQGPEFTAEYERLNGAQPIKGRKWSKGRWVESVKTKRQWQTQFRGKVDTARRQIADWFADPEGTRASAGEKATLLESMTARVKKDHATLCGVIDGTATTPFWKNFEGDVTDARKALADALKALQALQ